jgi:hypothetical protein
MHLLQKVTLTLTFWVVFVLSFCGKKLPSYHVNVNGVLACPRKSKFNLLFVAAGVFEVFFVLQREDASV